MKTWMTPNGVSVIRLLSGRSNVYLVRNEHYALAVDSGIRFERSLVRNRIARMLAGQPLSAIVLTHTHFDHAGNAAALKKTFNCMLMVHRSEAGFLRTGYSPVPDGAVPATRFLNKMDKHKIRFLVGTQPAEPDVLIGDEMDLGAFGIPVALKHTPGHSPGSVSLVIDNDVAVVGDNMVNVVPGKIFPPFCDNVPDMFESWKKLLGTGCRVFLPSHGKEVPRDLLEFSFLTQTKKWKQKHG